MARNTNDVETDAKTLKLSAAQQRARQRMVNDGGTPSLRGTIIKIILLGIADAMADQWSSALSPSPKASPEKVQM
jgi:hypothetical protein